MFDFIGKNKNPYKGMLVSIFFMCLPSAALFFIIYMCAKNFYDSDYSFILAAAFGLLVGFLGHIMMCIMGLFKGEFKAVVKRIAHFFSNVKVSFKFALTFYWEDLKEDGINFWVFSSIILTNIALCAMAWYQLYLIHIEYFI